MRRPVAIAPPRSAKMVRNRPKLIGVGVGRSSPTFPLLKIASAPLSRPSRRNASTRAASRARSAGEIGLDLGVAYWLLLGQTGYGPRLKKINSLAGDGELDILRTAKDAFNPHGQASQGRSFGLGDCPLFGTVMRERDLALRRSA